MRAMRPNDMWKADLFAEAKRRGHPPTLAELSDELVPAGMPAILCESWFHDGPRSMTSLVGQGHKHQLAREYKSMQGTFRRWNAPIAMFTPILISGGKKTQQVVLHNMWAYRKVTDSEIMHVIHWPDDGPTVAVEQR